MNSSSSSARRCALQAEEGCGRLQVIVFRSDINVRIAAGTCHRDHKKVGLAFASPRKLKLPQGYFRDLANCGLCATIWNLRWAQWNSTSFRSGHSRNGGISKCTYQNYQQQ